MKSNSIHWENDFPIREEVEDCCGQQRAFTISCHYNGLGFTVRAVEDSADGEGYEFAAYRETSPYEALGRVRAKMQRGLASRYLGGRPGNYHMLHDTIHGRIIGADGAGIKLIIDGKPLDMDNLVRILSTHEGWELELTITDSLE